MILLTAVAATKILGRTNVLRTHNDYMRLLNSQIADAVTGQKEQHDKLVEILTKRIKFLEDEVDERGAMSMVAYYFITKKHPELIPEYVELAYEECDKELARKEVAAIHDETFDLSTLKCTGKDFDKWDD